MKMSRFLILVLFTLVNPILLVHAQANAVTFDNGHIDIFHVKMVDGKPVLNLREDVTGAKRERDPESVQIVLPGRAYTEATKNIPGIGTPGWVSPQTQVRGVPWLGWDTNATGAETQIRFNSVSGPGTVYLFGENSSEILQFLNTGITLRSGSVLTQSRPAHVHATWVFTKAGRYQFQVSAGVGGRYSEPRTYTIDVAGGTQNIPIGNGDGQNQQQKSGNNPGRNTGNSPGQKPGEVPKTNQPANSAAPQQNQYDLELNTHVHPNWVFTKAGEYQVKIRQDVTLKSGKSVHDTAELTFIVGGAGNAKDGHFDLGLQIEKDAAKAKVRDDRVSPGIWRPPSELTFELSDAAKAKAPAGIEFIATPDTELWMIGATQLANVPWLGANSQDPSLLATAAGPVRWTLVEMTGPGGFAVFTQGNFGKPVDQVWFTAGEIAQPLAALAASPSPTSPSLTSAAPPDTDDGLLTGITVGVSLIGLGTLGYALYRKRRP